MRQRLGRIHNRPAAYATYPYILGHNQIALAKNLKIAVLPSHNEIALEELKGYEPSKQKLFYAGRDQTTLQRFASEKTNFLHVSQSNPRRNLQHSFLKEILKIQEVPETTLVDRIGPRELTFDEAMFLVRIRGVLLDDYLMPEVDVAFAKISHGVAFFVKRTKSILEISIAHDLPAAKMVVECYRTAPDVFDGFVKDFIREHLYPQIRDYVPSSTRQGRDALYKRLKENKELFRYEENEFGEIESLLADYLAGKTDIDQVLRSSGRRPSTQRQEVSKEQVGSVEQEMPEIIDSAGASPQQSEFEPSPPILRPDMETEMKVLTVSNAHDKLNKFQMFLALSDRAARTEGEFFRWPHTTKLIWASHRIIYIFTDATGGLSLYYDIELKESLESKTTGGAMFPTTTIVTKDRVYIPVPAELEAAFKITAGAKEFYVRFDTIP